MSCYWPLAARRDRASGAVTIVARGEAVGSRSLQGSVEGDPLELPCGHCVGCRMDRSRSWSIRCMHEAQLYDSNLFVTLDYAPEHLPKSLSLEYRDFQGFMKRLRKKIPGVSVAPNGKRPIRFFVAGEYGAKYQRPHWHAILFNCDFSDKVRFANGTYRSNVAERLWSRGNVVIGSVTPRSAAYCAGYTLNKRYGRGAKDFYEDVVDLATGEVSSRRPEFCVPSRRPGLGAWWYERYKSDLFPMDGAVMEGRKFKVPQYYWRKYQLDACGDVVERISEARYERARKVPLVESSEERRIVREEVATARLMLFSSREH